MRKFTFTWTVLALFIFGAITVQAQTKGSLAGTVTDASGAVVPGANVELKNNANGATRSAATGNAGVFQFTDVEPGTYTVTVQSTGFKKTVANDVIVHTSVASQITVALEAGQVSEVVTVTDAQEVVNTSSPTLTNVINTRQIVDLPLPDRNPLGLAALQAGIAVIGTDTRGSSVSGLRQTATNVTQDGINAMDNFVKTSSFFAISTPSLNSTAEFSITTGTTSSEQGRGVAQVNMVTRSGSNSFHGGGFLQLINDGYNSNTFFNNFNGIPTPLLHQHYWGGDIGGPVFFPNVGDDGPKIFDGRDKAFFFFSFERFVQNRAAARNRNGVLTQNALNGTFQYTCPATTTDPINCPANSTKSINLLTLGSVPSHALNPLMTAHLAQIPLPNNTNCTANDGFNIACFAFNVPELTTNNKYVARYDHVLFKDTRFGTHKLEVVYSRVDTNTHPDVFTNGVEAPFPGGVNAYQYSTRNLVTPALVSTFGSNWTNVLRYGRQWAPVVFDRDTQPTAPFISLPGVLINYDNVNMPQPRNTIVNQWTDTLSWVNGNHLWKFGGDFQRVLVKSFNSAGINETIQLGTNAVNQNGLTLANFPGLTNNTAGNAIVTNAGTVYNAIVGMLGSASQTLNVTSPDSGFVPGATRTRFFQEQDLALFAQDQWRMKSNFTLSYGVRWDWMGVPTVPNGLSIQPKYSDLFGVSGFGNLFHPTAPAGVPGAVATQQFVSGDTGIPLFKNDWDNFAPFLGIAYSPNFKKGPLHFLFGDEGTSSIRAGYSISYLHDGLTTISNALGTGTTNPGLIQTANLSSLSCVNPSDPSCVHSSNLRGQLGSGGVPLDLPTFIMPITDRQNIVANSTNGLWGIDPNLRSPYVEQWNIGFEREIFKDTAIEVRYVGNRGVKLWRAVDFNEVNIFENGFLQEFNNAKINLAARGGTSFAPFSAGGCATCVSTPILDKFFAGLAGSSGYTSSTFISNLNNNNVGTMASTLAFNTAYRTNRELASNNIPMNFFVANPNAAFARGLSNDSESDYNAMEVEFRRRFSQGLQFQVDYTWSKAMGNATDAQGNNQSDLVSWRSLRDKSWDYRRSTQDQTQRAVGNVLYELPFGRSKPFLNSSNGWVDRVVGGWTFGSIVTWSKGPPWYVAAGRATFTSATTNNGAQLVGMSFEDFKKNVGVFKDERGIFFINPDLLDITLNSRGQVATSKLKAGLMTAPAPGTFGNFPLNSLNAPSYFNVDMSLIKRIPITERVKLEIKFTAVNAFNIANFIYATQNFDSTSFGVISTQRDSGRNMSLQGQLRF
jgi:hypothetical protein